MIRCVAWVINELNILGPTLIIIKKPNNNHLDSVNALVLHRTFFVARTLLENNPHGTVIFERMPLFNS